MLTKKHLVFSILIILSALWLIGCKKKTTTEEIVFSGEVITVDDTTLLVRPDDHTYEDKKYSQMYVPLDTTITDANGKLTTSISLTPGTQVQITYDGATDDSDPALILNCFEIRILQ